MAFAMRQYYLEIKSEVVNFMLVLTIYIFMCVSAL